MDQCDGCQFYRPRVFGVDPDTKTVYECRYADPFLVGSNGAWPRVLPDDWCGKFVAASP